MFDVLLDECLYVIHRQISWPKTSLSSLHSSLLEKGMKFLLL